MLPRTIRHCKTQDSISINIRCMAENRGEADHLVHSEYYQSVRSLTLADSL
jgi:hypothetical protein